MPSFHLFNESWSDGIQRQIAADKVASGVFFWPAGLLYSCAQVRAFRALHHSAIGPILVVSRLSRTHPNCASNFGMEYAYRVSFNRLTCFVLFVY